VIKILYTLRHFTFMTQVA